MQCWKSRVIQSSVLTEVADDQCTGIAGSGRHGRAIDAADAMLKAANVRLLSHECLTLVA